MTTSAERRTKRSDRPIEALNNLLEATVARYSLRTVCLANEDGLVLVAAGEADVWETIAAVAPLLSRCSDARSSQLVRACLSEAGEYCVLSCETPNQNLFLITVGPNSGLAAAAAEHGGSGTQRILAA